MSETNSASESVAGQPAPEQRRNVYAELKAGMQKAREDIEKTKLGDGLIKVDFADRDRVFAAFQKRSSEVGDQLEKTPYTVIAKMNDRQVRLLGMHHNTDPTSPPLSGEEEQFNEFMSTTKKPTVMIEGMVRPEYNYDGGSRTEQRGSAIAKYGGEKGLAIFLAQESNLPLTSPEPSQAQLTESLEQYYSREEIMDYIFAGAYVQYVRDEKFNPDVIPFDEYVTHYITTRLGGPEGWEQEDVSANKYYQRFITQHADVLGEQPSIEQIAEVARDFVAPRNNVVSKTSGYMRDKHIFDQIEKATKAGDDVFLVFGSYHVFAYEQMLQNK